MAPNCDLGLTQRLAERIREAVSYEGVELGNDNVTLTVSVGITLQQLTAIPNSWWPWPIPPCIRPNETAATAYEKQHGASRPEAREAAFIEQS